MHPNALPLSFSGLQREREGLVIMWWHEYFTTFLGGITMWLFFIILEF